MTTTTSCLRCRVLLADVHRAEHELTEFRNAIMRWADTIKLTESQWSALSEVFASAS